MLIDPILYLNTENNWTNGNGYNVKSKDPRHAIWHETAHCLHMQKYKNNPMIYDYLNDIKLNPYQRGIVLDTLGEYAAENSVDETIAEIFARLMSGESYSKLHPEVFQIYTKYNGPLPRK